MADSSRLREAVERAVLAALDEHVPALRDGIIADVLRSLGDFSAEVPSTSAALNTAVAVLQERKTQAEILSTLLDGAARFSGRVALFVLRAASAQGWQARGLAQDDAIKTFKVDASTGLAAKAIECRAPVVGSMAEFDVGLATSLGAPRQRDALVLPLIVRNKVAALVYADSGIDPRASLDAPALEVLVRAAAWWIELSAIKKASGTNGEAVPAMKAAAAAAVPALVPMAAQPEPPPAPATAFAAALPDPAPVPAATVAPEEDETHRRAKRFARLLVEEIKLYNEAKVAQGRQNKNLYELLRDDIEKSRASYEKRYGHMLGSSTDYFAQELVRILADGNESLLGSNIPR